MLSPLFILQLALTFLVSSLWILGAVAAGNRFGSKFGGFIGGLPSTALLSLFFIGFTQSPQIASSGTTVFPLAIAVSGMFLVVFAWVAPRGFVQALGCALVAWFLGALAIHALHWSSFAFNLLIYAAAMVLAGVVLEKGMLIRSIPPSIHRSSWRQMSVRSAFGGAMVTLAVLVAKAGGSEIAGIASAFPAMFIATLTVSYHVHGLEFSRAMTKSLLVTGVITVAVFAIALRYFYLALDLYSGTAAALGVSGISAFLTHRFILPSLK